MSDDTPKPVLDLDAIFTEWNAHEARRAELHPANKASLFAALGDAGITRVVLTFNGGGDSGQTEKIEAFAGDELRDLPDTPVELSDLNFREAEPTVLSQLLAEAIETLAYTCLESRHCGWENNEGGYGEFVFDVAEGAMGHCYHHALSSVKKWGGLPDDYLPLHQWFDEPSKLIIADFRHRALRHHAEGVFMLERFFGVTITLSSGRTVPVRLIGEQHIVEDLGFIPSFADWVRCIRPEPWMGRAQPIHKLVDPFAAVAD